MLLAVLDIALLLYYSGFSMCLVDSQSSTRCMSNNNTSSTKPGAWVATIPESQNEHYV